MIHLLPPELPKSGAHLELPIALTCLILCCPEELQPMHQKFLDEHLFVGALGLNGAILQTPVSRAIEASNSNVIGPSRFESLEILWNHFLFESHLHGNQASQIQKSHENQVELTSIQAPSVEGRHWERLWLLASSMAQIPVLMLGPPGVGKSHLARWAAATKRPSKNPESQEIIRQIWSLAGLNAQMSNPLITPQPRSHLSEFTGTVSSGTAKPGYFSLSHLGTLLIDEFTELSKDCREILRFILDEKSFMRSSKSGSVVWPADFWLIATSNPCPCGYSIGDDVSKCRCSENVRHAYRSRFSGPIWDRFGLKLFLDKRESKAELPEETKHLLDSPVEILHSTIEKLEPSYQEKLKGLEDYSNTSSLIQKSKRSKLLTSKLLAALSVLVPSISEESWAGLISAHQMTEESWKG